MTEMEPCDGCECGMAEEDTTEEELPTDTRFLKQIREHVIEELDLVDEATFIKRVEICPDESRVVYREK